MVVAVFVLAGFLILPILVRFAGSELGIEWATIHPLKVLDNLVA
jgi:hypothetical protein